MGLIQLEGSQIFYTMRLNLRKCKRQITTKTVVYKKGNKKLTDFGCFLSMNKNNMMKVWNNKQTLAHVCLFIFSICSAHFSPEDSSEDSTRVFDLAWMQVELMMRTLLVVWLWLIIARDQSSPDLKCRSKCLCKSILQLSFI